MGRLNYMVLGKEEINSIFEDRQELDPNVSSAVSSSVSINRDDWLEKNIASTMSVHFRILNRLVEKRFSEQELSDMEVMELAGYISVNYVDNLLGQKTTIEEHLDM